MSGDKLVRDNLPEIYKDKTYHVANDSEYHRELIKKLQEEVDEFKESEEVEELADILEVVYAIANFKEVSAEELNKIREKKAEQKGRFEKKIIYES